MTAIAPMFLPLPKPKPAAFSARSFWRLGFLYVATVLLVADGSAAQVSSLWGERGEKYDPAGLLPDFSFAGYERGEKQIPETPAQVMVKQFGAVGDGKTDDTASFQRAIKEASGKVIGIPPGRYLISDILEITEPNTVLKGAGTDKTTLVFTKALQTLRPTASETGDGKATTAWSWSGGLVWFKGVNPVGAVLARISPAGAKRGAISIPVDDAAKFSVGQEVAIEVKDDTEGSFVKYIFRDQPDDAGKLIGKQAYRYVVRIREINGQNVVIDRPLRFDLRPEWNATLRRFEPKLQHSGIEDLTFEFPRQPYRGHWEEDGFNALQFESCVHCWARRLVIHNCDSGVFTSGYFCTISDIIFTANRRPETKGHTGHHGIEADSVDNLITRFRFKTRFFHELTVAHAIGNVFSDGGGEYLTLDHHKGGPYENLFTHLDTGNSGPEAWQSGGPPGVGRHSASGETFWNIHGKKDTGLPPGDWGPSGLVFVGIKGAVPAAERRADWHYEAIGASSLVPQDLHLAQLEHRLSAARSNAPATALQRWTTASGQTFNAQFSGMEGLNVIFTLQDGRRATYPFASLSSQSQTLATGLTKGRQ